MGQKEEQNSPLQGPPGLSGLVAIRSGQWTGWSGEWSDMGEGRRETGLYKQKGAVVEGEGCIWMGGWRGGGAKGNGGRKVREWEGGGKLVYTVHNLVVHLHTSSPHNYTHAHVQSMFHTALKQSKTGGWNSLETRLGQHTIKLLVHVHQLESHVHHMLPSHLHGELNVSPNSMCLCGNPIFMICITTRGGGGSSVDFTVLGWEAVFFVGAAVGAGVRVDWWTDFFLGVLLVCGCSACETRVALRGLCTCVARNWHTETAAV